MPDWDCCSPDAPCSEGEGDCEVDADCQGSLRCGYNNCGDNDPTGVMDCCTPQVSCKSGSSWMAWHCCTEDQPCGFKEGDCNTDSECEGDLVCGQDNCVAVGREDSHWRMDCCVPPGFTVPEPEPTAEPETTSEAFTTVESGTTTETVTTAEPEPTAELSPTAPSDEMTTGTWDPGMTGIPGTTFKPEPPTEPDPTSWPEPTSEPELTSETEPTSEPKPTSEPEPTSWPEPSAEPETTAEPEPTAMLGTAAGLVARTSTSLPPVTIPDAKTTTEPETKLEPFHPTHWNARRPGRPDSPRATSTTPSLAATSRSTA